MHLLQSLRQFIHRVYARWFDRRASRAEFIPLIVPGLTIHRDVSPNGVRVYSLCGSCGARLQASATLCEECAQGRSRSAPPF
jgi:hypothetical protein